MIPEHYWMCVDCAKNMGGHLADNTVCTVTSGQCPYCKKENSTIIPWVDFNWPKDRVKNKIAKVNRD